MTMQLNPGDLIIIAGRPNTGKSTFAATAAFSVAARDHSAIVFSLSEAKERWGNLWHHPQLTQNPEFKKVVSRVLIDDTHGLSVESIAARIRRLRLNASDGWYPPFQLAVIDYLELLEETDAAARLKQLAIEVQLPIVALANLERKLEQRDDKRPTLGDLRRPSVVEHADKIGLLYRPGIYLAQGSDDCATELVFAKGHHAQEKDVTPFSLRMDTLLPFFRGELIDISTTTH